MEKKYYKHPSFGVISINKISGKSGFLFGSSLQCDDFVEIKIQRGMLTRDLCEEHYSPDFGNENEDLIKIKISPAQFAELITTLNAGSGTPCTIESIQGVEVEQTKMESKKTHTQRAFKERLQTISDKLSQDNSTAVSIIKKKNLSEGDRIKLKNIIDSMSQEVNSNIPFFLQCYQEYIDKVTMEGKAELDSMYQGIIHRCGLRALEEMNRQDVLPNQSDEG